MAQSACWGFCGPSYAFLCLRALQGPEKGLLSIISGLGPALGPSEPLARLLSAGQASVLL